MTDKEIRLLATKWKRSAAALANRPVRSGSIGRLLIVQAATYEQCAKDIMTFCRSETTYG